ncbi:MAG: orotidine-5'-phosphate decarboxylase [Firmicutes bacterium]|nr:orotidine-5'-phosphate decarboxylase [Bacillota bacterium]
MSEQSGSAGDKARLWIALDVGDQEGAELWMKTFPLHRHYKVGMELFYRIGPQVLRQWIEEKELHIFLDLKLHDIPRTVGRAIAQLDKLGVHLVTIHLAGGAKMCEAAKEASHVMDIVGVSVLTSLGSEDLAEMGIKGSVSDHIKRLVRIARQAELQGVVISGQELPEFTDLWPDARFVVPGIRRSQEALYDQKRVITADQALLWGATDLVIGRTLLAAEKPEAVYQELAALLPRKGP